MKGTDRKNCAGSVDLPEGLRRALAQNSRARTYYAGLSAEEQQSVVAGAQSLRSSCQLQEYVDTIIPSG